MKNKRDLIKVSCARCNGILLADSEHWDNPLCPNCYWEHSPQAMFPAAINEINNVIIEGEKTHKKDEWRTMDLKIPTHLQHALDHIRAVDSKKDKEENLMNISHAATRCLMALQLLLEEIRRNDGNNV